LASDRPNYNEVDPMDRPRNTALKLDVPLPHPVLGRLFERVRPGLERALGLTALEGVLDRIGPVDGVDAFVTAALRELGVTYRATELDVARVPQRGPCVLVSNHPFGGVEGLVLAALLRERRNDVRILANFLLSRVTALTPLFFFVDPFEGRGRPSATFGALREATRWVAAGGVLVVFPAGEVASFQRDSLAVTEPPWRDTAARIAVRARAPVVPAYFEGHNSALFHAAGLVHARLRTALLPRELLNKRGACLDVRFGAPIAPERLAALPNDAARIEHLRHRTEALALRTPDRPAPTPLLPRIFGRPAPRELAPVIGPVDPGKLERELERLPPGQILIDEGSHVVAWARAKQIPELLREIGRLRETTFREVEEGTGKAVDLDRFDAHYMHLFAFSRRDRHLVGAYRLGASDEILPRRGVAGLYTSTLFRMSPELFRSLGPCLEMGRSFVCSRYQRSTIGLFALWRGIGRFLITHPRYRVLFGPVSISQAYRPASRELMLDHLEARHSHPFRHWVEARNPYIRRERGFQLAQTPGARLLHIDDVGSVVSDIEPDRKGVPVLIKQYLRLGGRMLGFNVDPDFSDVLDGLVLVDLVDTDPKVLARYLGDDESRAFLGRPPRVKKAG
jgi:putative hemolysin